MSPAAGVALQHRYSHSILTLWGCETARDAAGGNSTLSSCVMPRRPSWPAGHRRQGGVSPDLKGLVLHRCVFLRNLGTNNTVRTHRCCRCSHFDLPRSPADPLPSPLSPPGRPGSQQPASMGFWLGTVIFLILEALGFSVVHFGSKPPNAKL